MENNAYEAVMTALQEAHLDFEAMMRPVSFLGVDGEHHETKMFTPVSSDNGTIISEHTFTKSYRPIQNRDAFKVIADIASVTDIEFKNVGCWGNGAGVYAQIALGDDMVVGGGDDRVGRYLSVVNSHDGTRGCTILITPFRFFCQNQIAAALSHADRDNLFRVRHNSLAEGRLRILGESLRIAEGVFVKTAEVYNRLADKIIDMDFVREGIARNLPFKGEEETPEEPTTHFENMLTGMINRFNSADHGNVERMTAWNLYNAIQGTFQHDSRNTANKNFSVLCGGIAGKSQTALNNIIEMVDRGYEKTSTTLFDRAFARVA
jgi:phage/plasmid-like protein (TIGR03299 family)